MLEWSGSSVQLTLSLHLDRRDLVGGGAVLAVRCICCWWVLEEVLLQNSNGLT